MFQYQSGHPIQIEDLWRDLLHLDEEIKRVLLRSKPIFEIPDSSLGSSPVEADEQFLDLDFSF